MQSTDIYKGTNKIQLEKDSLFLTIYAGTTGLGSKGLTQQACVSHTLIPKVLRLALDQLLGNKLLGSSWNTLPEECLCLSETLGHTHFGLTVWCEVNICFCIPKALGYVYQLTSRGLETENISKISHEGGPCLCELTPSKNSELG